MVHFMYFTYFVVTIVTLGVSESGRVIHQIADQC